MTARIQKFTTSDNEEVLIEVSEAHPIGKLQPISQDATTGAAKFSEVVEGALPVVKAMKDEITKTVGDVKQVELEFGIKISTGFRAFVAKADGEVNFLVKVTW